ARDVRGIDGGGELVCAQGRVCHVVDVVAGRDAGCQGYAGGAGEGLDGPARPAYKRRLLDLETELKEAERFNDPGRLARAQQEREFLQAELTRAVGLRGRSRRAGAASERARANVTKGLGLTIEKMPRANPGVGQHLAAAVRRGLYCSYTPDPRVALRWEV